MHSYGSLFAQTVQEQNALFERLCRKDSIDGRRVSILCLAKPNAMAPSVFLPEGCVMSVVPYSLDTKAPINKEQACLLWQAYDAAQQKGNMLFVCSDESGAMAHSVVRGFLQAQWYAPVDCEDAWQLDKAIVQMMCDVRSIAL